MTTVRWQRGGVDLVVDVGNRSVERTVVFLPTTGECRGVWDTIAPSVGKLGWRTVAPDYRGHGDSGRASTYDLDDFCADARELVENLTGAPRVLVGGSIGGIIALHLLAEMGVDACGLVLVDIVPAPRFEAGQRERRKIAAATARGNPATESLDPRLLDGSLATEVIVRRDRLREAAQRIDISTLLLHGERSHVIGARELADFHRDFRLGEALAIPGAGHLVARDQPELVAKALTEFLGRSSKRRAPL